MAASYYLKFAIALTTLLLYLSSSFAQLSPYFYSTSCPNLLPTVRSVVNLAILNEARIGASLLRLFFHDCFVNGCDGSILLDDTPSFTGEKTAFPNRDSVRGYNVIDDIKSAVEEVCPGVVSCADIVAIAARDSVNILAGPNWSVKLGRRDSINASLSAANSDIPSPALNFSGLVSSFNTHGLSIQDLVALSGAHTIGQARCTTFRRRIYNESNIDPLFANIRQGGCPGTNGVGDNNLAPLDQQSPTTFDNNYFKNLLIQSGLLHSDQQLFNGGSTDSLVRNYAINPNAFTNDFVAAIIKMGDISPLTGSKGEIRMNCSRKN